jgi:hypothetical protein
MVMVVMVVVVLSIPVFTMLLVMLGIVRVWFLPGVRIGVEVDVSKSANRIVAAEALVMAAVAVTVVVVVAVSRVVTETRVDVDALLPVLLCVFTVLAGMTGLREVGAGCNDCKE